MAGRKGINMADRCDKGLGERVRLINVSYIRALQMSFRNETKMEGGIGRGKRKVTGGTKG